MNQHNESGKRDPAVFDALQRSFTYYSEKAATSAAERNALWAQHNDLRRQFSQELFSEMKRLQTIIVPLMAALRRELELDGDAAIFMEQMNGRTKHMEEKLNSVFVQLKAFSNKS